MSNTVNTVLFNSGEGVVSSDLNDLQNYDRAITNDLVFGTMARIAYVDGGPSLNKVYSAPGPSGIVPSATANQVISSATTIYMRDSSAGLIDGVTPRFLAYRLGSGELTLTLTPDPTLPRWVGIFIKLDLVDNTSTVSRDFQDATTLVVSSSSVVKSRIVQLTSSVVNGTPNASPVVPATPANYAPLCYVYVSAAHAGTFNFIDLADARYPVGFRSTFVHYRDLVQNSGLWTEDKINGAIASSGTGTFNVIAQAGIPANARIVSCTWFTSGGTFSATPEVHPGRNNLGSTASTSAAAATGTGVVSCDFNLSPVGTDTVGASGNTGLDGPLWGNGYRHPGVSVNSIGGTKFIASITAGTLSIYGCRIDYVG